MKGRPRPRGRPCKRKKDYLLLATRSRRWRGARGRGALLRHPLHLAAIILEAFGAFEGVFVRVHDQVPLIIVLVGDLDGIEGNGDVLRRAVKRCGAIITTPILSGLHHPMCGYDLVLAPEKYNSIAHWPC